MIDENNNLYPFEEAPSKKVVEVTILSSGEFFGEEEAILLMMNMSHKKEGKEGKEGKDGSYRLNQYIKRLKLEKDLFGDNLSKEKQTIITARGEETLIYSRNMDHNLIKRETTMTVISPTAEIWRIPAKVFYYKLSCFNYFLDIFCSDRFS